MNIELVITAALTILAVGVSIYSASISARRNTVENLATLIDKLERRLSEEEKARKELEKKLVVANRYIRILIDQLRKHNIVPIDPPEEFSSGI